MSILTKGVLQTGSTKAWIGGFGEVCPFGLVSDGKRVVANAITAKGVSTSETATFATMANNISSIFQLDTSDATATAAQILSGYTAYVRGSKISGTMTNRGAVTSTLNCGNSYTIPAGYHNGSGKVTANSLASQTSATATAARILSGYTAWVNGSKITGTATQGVNLEQISMTSVTLSDVSPGSNYYWNGDGRGKLIFAVGLPWSGGQTITCYVSGSKSSVGISFSGGTGSFAVIYGTIPGYTNCIVISAEAYNDRYGSTSFTPSVKILT